MKTTHWQNVYGKAWGDLVVKECSKHPAKYSRALIYRIAKHMREQGYVQRGDTVLDPFGGVALGAIPFLPMGINWAGMELEVHFVKMAQANIEKWNCEFARHGQGWGRATIWQGDSRYLLPLLARAQAVVGSPPYGVQGGGRTDGDVAGDGGQENLAALSRGYGETPGQLGEMGDKDFDVVVGSPPYSGIRQDGGRMAKEGTGGFGAYTDEPPEYWHTQRKQDNLGNMPSNDFDAVVGSPPYADSVSGDDPKKRGGIYRDPKRANDVNLTAEYGKSDGQIGAMGEGGFAAAVSPPPYGGSDMRGGETEMTREKKTTSDGYGKTRGQMGAMPSSFWGAAKLIVSSCHDQLRPGGVAVWVVKNYARDFEVVPFSERWLELNLACGFTHVETIIAHQTDNPGLVQQSLFGDDEQLETRRAGLFRILYEKKGGPKIDHESVFILQK